MTGAIKCPSRTDVEICAVLGFNSGKNGLIILDGCGYCDAMGRCHYRGRIRHAAQSAPGAAHREPEYRREHRKEQRRRGQVSLHAFLGRC